MGWLVPPLLPPPVFFLYLFRKNLGDKWYGFFTVQMLFLSVSSGDEKSKKNWL